MGKIATPANAYLGLNPTADQYEQLNRRVTKIAEEARRDFPARRAREQLEYEQELEKLRLEARTRVGSQKTPPKKSGRHKGTAVNAGKLSAYRGLLPQAEFAEKCGVSVATIQRGEAGGRWSDSSFQVVAEAITLLNGKVVTPKDIKNLKN